MATTVSFVTLLRPVPHCKTPANKLAVPKGVHIVWSNTRRQTVELEYLARGAARDVFEAVHCGFVLKIQSGKYHDTSNLVEYNLSQSKFQEFMPVVYGSTLCEWEGEQVSILIVERVEHTLKSFCSSLIQIQPRPTKDDTSILLQLFPGIFEHITRAVGTLNYQLSDLHWDNIGVCSQTQVLTFLDCEGCREAPQARSKVKIGRAMLAFFSSIRMFIDNITHKLWKDIFNVFYSNLQTWWFRHCPHKLGGGPLRHRPSAINAGSTTVDSRCTCFSSLFRSSNIGRRVPQVQISSSFTSSYPHTSS